MQGDRPRVQGRRLPIGSRSSRCGRDPVRGKVRGKVRVKVRVQVRVKVCVQVRVKVRVKVCVKVFVGKFVGKKMVGGVRHGNGDILRESRESIGDVPLEDSLLSL